MKYFFHILICLILCLSVSPNILIAAATNPTGPGTLTNPTGSGTLTNPTGPGTLTNPTGDGSLSLKNPIQAKSIGELFQAIIDIVLVFAIPIVVFFIILAGFRYVTARGNGHVIEEAHMALLYALIGGVLILGARVLIEVISGTVDAIKG
jgi:hypothetical protein